MNITLEERFLTLKQQTNRLTSNPLLNCFSQKDLAAIDNLAKTDRFIAEKRANILNLVKDIIVHFNDKLKSAFDEYNEALTLMRLKLKFPEADRIKETNDKTPDFIIPFIDGFYEEGKLYEVYAELKSLSFTDGNLNYLNAMEQAVNAQISIDEQISAGRAIAFGEFEIQPLNKRSKKGKFYSVKDDIETLIDKIDQNIKQGQFMKGETVLIVDLKQIGSFRENFEQSTPIYQERLYNSFVSGELWNVAFGKAGHLIYMPIEFEGKENVDGELEREGILVSRPWIKAICFITYTLAGDDPKIVGLRRYKDRSEGVDLFLSRFCDFINDDFNTHGFMVNPEL